MAKKSKASQKFVPIESIRDGVITLKDGGMRGLLMVSAINFGLKSPEEQQATLFQYQSFLNGLDFSIQIVVQSRKMDIRPYIQSLENRLLIQEEELLRIQTRMYIKYIKTFSQQVDVMKKYFYVVVPYYPSGANTYKKKRGISSYFTKKTSKQVTDQAIENFEEQRAQLLQRMSLVQSGLGSAGLQAAPLGTQECIEVYYNLYNPGDSQGDIVNTYADQ